MDIGEADYLIRRAGAQLELARRAELHEVSIVHLELSSRYLERARDLIDAERRQERRANVVAFRR